MKPLSSSNHHWVKIGMHAFPNPRYEIILHYEYEVISY